MRDVRLGMRCSSIDEISFARVSGNPRYIPCGGVGVGGLSLHSRCWSPLSISTAQFLRFSPRSFFRERVIISFHN